MAITSFIPVIWDARLLENLRKNLVYANLLNTSYEGAISQEGDTVKINFLGDITVKDYDQSQEIESETLSTTALELKIDKAHYFNFQVDDIEKVQARADLIGAATANASYKMADKSDITVAEDLATNGTLVAGLGTNTTPLVVGAKNDTGVVGAYELLVSIKTKLDKVNTPKQDRWVVVPPEFEGMMLLDSRFIAVGTVNSEKALVEGTVYRAAGFDIHVSNNVPNTAGTKFKIIASYKEAASYANQILKTEPYRAEKGFKDGVKGLHVYGHKVVRPGNIAVSTVNFSPEVVK